MNNDASKDQHSKNAAVQIKNKTTIDLRNVFIILFIFIVLNVIVIDNFLSFSLLF